MKAIAARAIPIPDNLDIYFLNSEYPARDDITALEAVMESNDEIQQLEAKAEALNNAMADADEDGQAEIQQSLVCFSMLSIGMEYHFFCYLMQSLSLVFFFRRESIADWTNSMLVPPKLVLHRFCSVLDLPKKCNT